MSIIEDQSRPSSERSRFVTGIMIFLIALVIVVVLTIFSIYFIGNKAPTVPVVHWVPPKDNSFQDFVILGQSIQKANIDNPYDSKESPEYAPMDKVTAAFEKSGPSMAQVRELMQRPYEIPPVTDLKATFPYVANYRKISRLFHLEADYYQRTNQPEKAMQSMVDGMRFGIKTGRGGIIIHALVGTICEATAMEGMEDLLPQLSPNGLRQLIDELEKLQGEREDFSEALMHEGLYTRISLATIMADPERRSYDGFFRYLTDGEYPPSNDPAFITQAVRFNMTAKTRMLDDLYDHIKTIAAESKKPVYLQKPVSEPKGILAAVMLPVFARADRQQETRRTVLEMIRIEAAIRLFEIDNSRLPKRLQELAPKYLPTIRSDPFNGKPFHYSTKKKGVYLLYSVSTNLVDDRGKPEKYPGYNTGDMVAGHLTLRSKPLGKSSPPPSP